MNLWTTAIGLGAALSLAGAATAAKRPPVDASDSQALQPVLACRTIAADAARLACFDQATRSLQEASAKRDIVVVDRNAITKVRRSLFGFSAPSLDIFKGAKADEPEQDEIASTVRSASRDADGNWIVTIEDGAVWHQTGGIVGGAVRPGDKVVIKRGTLGSYFLRIGSRPGVRARREG